MNTYGYVSGNPLRFVDPYGLRVFAAELNIFGYGVGVFFDTGTNGLTLFEGVSDFGIFVDRPTNGLSSFSLSDLPRKLRASLRFTNADNRCDFDADGERFNANLLLFDFTSDTRRTTVGVGLNIPIPVTEVKDSTTNATSLRDIFR